MHATNMHVGWRLITRLVKLEKYLESTRIRKGRDRSINPVNQLSIFHIIWNQHE